VLELCHPNHRLACARFLLGLLIKLLNMGDMFLRNVAQIVHGPVLPAPIPVGACITSNYLEMCLRADMPYATANNIRQ
jgi:hypothetical protein